MPSSVTGIAFDMIMVNMTVSMVMVSMVMVSMVIVMMVHVSADSVTFSMAPKAQCLRDKRYEL